MRCLFLAVSSPKRSKFSINIIIFDGSSQWRHHEIPLYCSHPSEWEHLLSPMWFLRMRSSFTSCDIADIKEEGLECRNRWKKISTSDHFEALLQNLLCWHQVRFHWAHLKNYLPDFLLHFQSKRSSRWPMVRSQTKRPVCDLTLWFLVKKTNMRLTVWFPVKKTSM